MEIQSIRPYGSTTNFKGVEQMASKKVANVALVGGGGRIGRNVLREYLLANHAPKGVYNSWDRLKEIIPLLNIVAINMGSMGLKGGKTIQDVGDEDLISQIRNDSVLGRLPECIATSIKRSEAGDVFLHVESANKQEDINLVATRDDVDFSRWNAEILLDATGARTSKAAMQELKDGTPTAQYALLSAPDKEKDKSVTPMPMVVAHVNDGKIAEIKEAGGIASSASCTTTCIAPIIKFMHEKFGVDCGTIETTHAATATQFTADKSNKEADSKKRGSFDSMIPTTTGAAKAVGRVVADLNKRLDGAATRVPTANGSMAILNLSLDKADVTVDEIKAALEEASKSEEYKDLIAFAPKGSSSKDVLGRHESALIIPESFKVVKGKHSTIATIKAYYDNEFGYTRSYLTLANEVAKDVVAQKQA